MDQSENQRENRWADRQRDSKLWYSVWTISINRDRRGKPWQGRLSVDLSIYPTTYVSFAYVLLDLVISFVLSYSRPMKRSTFHLLATTVTWFYKAVRLVSADPLGGFEVSYEQM